MQAACPGGRCTPLGETTETDEYILQCRVDDAHLSAVLAAIRDAHPYEEPVIDVVKLWK